MDPEAPYQIPHGNINPFINTEPPGTKHSPKSYLPTLLHWSLNFNTLILGRHIHTTARELLEFNISRFPLASKFFMDLRLLEIYKPFLKS